MKKARDEHDSETVLVCAATYFPDIAPSIRELVERIEADWVAADNAKEEAELEERYEFYELFEGSTNGPQRVLV